MDRALFCSWVNWPGCTLHREGCGGNGVAGTAHCYPCVVQHSNCGCHRCQAVWDRCCYDKELLELFWGSGAGGNGKWTLNGVAWLPE